MKRFLPLLVSLIGALVLSSCYMMSIRPTGTIRINLGGASGRTISGTAKVRVYLYTYNSTNNFSLYTFPTGKSYAEFSYGSGTQSLTGIPAGLWQVLVSVGSDGPSGTDAFYTQQYGTSPVIDVIANADTSASITTKSSPFVYSKPLAGQNLNGVTFDYTHSVTTDFSIIMVSSASSLYEIVPSLTSVDLSTDIPTAVTGLPSGLVINSLSDGMQFDTNAFNGYAVYINSNQGIIPYYYSNTTLGPGLTTTFSSALTGTNGAPLDILRSGAVPDPLSGGAAIYYARAQGYGGVDINANSPTPGVASSLWVDYALPATTAGSSIYALAADQFTSTTGDAYFATSDGAFRATPTLVTSPGTLTNVVSFTAPNNETIQAIAVDDYDKLLYIGTPQGAYYGTLNESSTTSVISGSWNPIPATMGDDIVSITADSSTGDGASGYLPPTNKTGPEAVAFRSPYNIYVLNNPPTLGGTETTYPFYAGVPGTINSMTFGYGTLYVAGSEGLASVVVQ